MNKITDPKIKRLLISHNLFMAGRIFFEIFLSVYIWKVTSDIKLVAWFNMAYLFLHTFSFTIFAPLVKKGKFNFTRRLSLLGYTLVYFWIYYLGDSIIDYTALIGILIGFFNGIYWISYQTVRFDSTNSLNRGNYTGVENGMKIIVGIVMPALGGVYNYS